MKHNPLYIEIHALQTVPPSNINRDDTGSPKTARFGGVTRARVSSQAWKKAIRDEFSRVLNPDELGQRTKHVVDLIAAAIEDIDSQMEHEEAISLASGVLAATGIKVGKDNSTGYLVFVSAMQAKRLAQLAIDANRNGQKVSAKEAKRVLNAKESPNLNAVDIAMFGRMVADDPSLNVDAAVQVAHAIGVNRSEVEFDYFTALDDCSPADNAGAAMIETTEFLSAMLYRYATIDVYHLYENLGSVDVAQKAVGAFVKAFITSMPTGKQNSFANRTLPSAVIVKVSDVQPVNLVNAFERPIAATADKNMLEVACEKLIEQEKRTCDAFGLNPLMTYTISAGAGSECLKDIEASNPVSLGGLLAELDSQVSSYLFAVKASGDIEVE